DWVLPIEWVEKINESTVTANVTASPGLAVIPILHGLFWPLGWLGLLGACVWLLPPFWRLALYLRHKEETRASHLCRIADHKSRVAVCLSGSERVAYQVNQWLPVLEELAVPVVIIVRERHCIKGISLTI